MPYPADGLIALAAAEAPGRVAALEAALERIAHEPCWDEPVSCLSRFRALAAEALAAPAPTPSEPVERVDGWMTEKCSNCPHVKGRHLPDWGCMVPDASAPCGCTLSFTPATRAA